jgi:hypothetical protein
MDAIARDIAVLGRAGYPLVYVVTQEEDRAVRLVRAAARMSKKDVVRWTASVGFDQPDLGSRAEPEVGLEGLEALEQPAFVMMLDLHPYLDRPGVVRRLRDRLPGLVERRQTVVVVGPVLRLPPELEKDCAVVDLPLPRPEDLRAVLDAVARSEGHAVDDRIADRAVRSALGLSLHEAQRVFRKTLVLKKGLSEADLGLIVEEKKAALRTSDALEFHELGPGLAEVGGLDELKRWLSTRSEAFGPEAREFGLPPPKGLLLLGVQGCGKSLSAKAVAELWKFPLLRLDLSTVFAGGSASPEAAIRQAIKVAESLAPVVLWVDEIEKGFHQVGQDDAGSRVFGSFITWLAEKNAEVFVVATANDVSGLPPELLRRGRFDEVFFVDLPNRHERLEILRIHLRRRDRDPDGFGGLEGVARRTEHFSGAELEQVVVSALYRAFADGRRPMTDEDLELAVKQTVPLYATYEERIKQLRDWARTRARFATQDASVLDLFGVS